jgi:hypothetical protein
MTLKVFTAANTRCWANATRAFIVSKLVWVPAFAGMTAVGEQALATHQRPTFQTCSTDRSCSSY